MNADEKLESKLGHKIKLLSNAYNRILNESLAEWDVTGAQSFILGYIAHSGFKPCQRDIEKRFRIKHPTATGILKRLEEKGLVAFESDEHDKRLKRISLTDEGRRLDETSKRSLDETEERLTSSLTEEELAQLHTLLDKIVERLFEDNILTMRKEDEG